MRRREALERQTATAEILKVIASSPSDVQPVFEAIVASAEPADRRLCRPAMFRFVDDTDPSGGLHADESRRRCGAAILVPDAAIGRVSARRDWSATAAPCQIRRYRSCRARRIAGHRAGTGLSQHAVRAADERGQAVGIITLSRAATPARSPTQHVQLLQMFADQAVIAIENVRLFNETQGRRWNSRPRRPTFSRSSAVSPSDVQPVFETIARVASRVCWRGFQASCYLCGRRDRALCARFTFRPIRGLRQAESLFRPHAVKALCQTAARLKAVHIHDRHESSPELPARPAMREIALMCASFARYAVRAVAERGRAHRRHCVIDALR